MIPWMNMWCWLSFVLHRFLCRETELASELSANETYTLDELHMFYLADAYRHYCKGSIGCNETDLKFLDIISDNPYLSWPTGDVSSCCVPCLCDLNVSFIMHDLLCPEVALENIDLRQGYRQTDRCHSTFVKLDIINSPFNLEVNGFYFIDRCDQRWIDVAEAAHDDAQNTVIKKCHQSSKFSDIRARTPVSSVYGDAIFKNRYCAECNFVQLIENWTPKISCYHDSFDMIAFDDVITAIEKSTACNMNFIAPTDSDPLQCKTVISECNLTGQWDIYDPYIEDACNFYHIPFQFLYKNLFCFMCNSKSSDNIPLCQFNPSVFVNFEVILRLDIYESDVMTSAKNKDENCSENELYDRFQETCLPVSCLAFKVLRNGACVNAVDKISGFCSESFIKMTPAKPTVLSDDEVNLIVLQKIVPILLDEKDQIYTSVRRRHADDINNIDGAIGDVIYILSHVVICFHQSVGPTNVERMDNILKLHGTTFKSISDTVLSVELDIFSYSATISNNSDVADPTSLRSTFVTYVDSDENVSFSGLFRRFSSEEWSHETFLETLLPLHSCPNVPLNATFYTIDYHHWGIFIKELGVSLRRNEFIFSPLAGSSNESSLIICKDRLAQAFSSSYSSGDIVGRVRFPFAFDGVLSLTCSSISIACCLLTVVCYSCLKDMQTQPCINNLSLALSLVLAQSLFQFGSGQAKHIEKWVCQALGILTHYFWLVTILWMNVCSYHMYKVFRKDYALPTRPVERKKVTLLYWVYCLALAALPVAANVTVEMVMSGQQHIGYGGVLCYISKNEMIGYFFIGPAVIVICSNMCLFGITVFNIGTSKSTNFFERDRSLLAIYMKLSTLTGVTWIFGFLSVIFHNVDVLGYLFIILNAGQGLFIFVSFICSKRVLNCLKREISSNLSRVFKTESA